MSETKIIIITGASSGIGEAVALELSKAGHVVVVGARRTDRLHDLASRIEASGGTARAHRLDVTSRDDFDRVLSATLEEFGRVDVIVNNAGVMPLSPLRALKVSEWNQMVDVNIKGVLNGIAAVAMLLVRTHLVRLGGAPHNPIRSVWSRARRPSPGTARRVPLGRTMVLKDEPQKGKDRLGL